MKGSDAWQRRIEEARIGLSREVRPCGQLSKNRKPCERYIQPYDPWCWEHCSEVEKELGSLLRKAYWEGRKEQLSWHGLMKFGETIDPEFILGIRAIALRDDMSAEERIRMITDALRDF